MADLEFKIYKVPSEFGEWLAAFEADELIFLGHYGTSKTLVQDDLAKLFEQNYSFKVGKFEAAKWTKGNFWKTKHKIKIQGTDFQMKVWLELLKIPAGKTVSYSELAKKIRKPEAVRAVASAVAKNPVAFYIPCHRVVGKGSSLAAKLKYHWGTELKRNLLQSEGAL
ncbi:methylated-DNA--[protein]-cysteine S-methyltransferase [Bdellovibrio sp. NC01]|uniref:methylated-DNA--[protein]-cysteine S-methyltransferase n=1 Tax=Bdellovibrio sp. NC01 TaxID=2220073 RepID=UPI001159DD7A|nr:methylated-DNA--[protein]-cysteine S-methyltransferase [Bdellovibrio sp. NC01]QDK36471.1 methylated-DNA--[protein]-cysteine S-methyltransferase [Bdellovibrio sp. NC01]